jgi:ribonuclease P protein component
MISRKNRFHGHGSLRYVYRNGKTVRGPLCAMKYIDNPKRAEYRLAVVVSKKVHKSAVVRNRIRRRIYEAVRLEAPAMKGAFDIVLTVFNDQIATIPSAEVTNLVHAQLKQAKILQPSRNAPRSMVE